MKLFSLTILFMLPVTSIYAMDLPGIAAFKDMLHKDILHSSGTPKFPGDKGNSKKPSLKTPADQQNPKKQR